MALVMCYLCTRCRVKVKVQQPAGEHARRCGVELCARLPRAIEFRVLSWVGGLWACRRCEACTPIGHAVSLPACT